MDGDSVSSNGSGALSYDMGSKSEKATIEVDIVTVTTSASEGRLYIGSTTDGMPSTGVWASLLVYHPMEPQTSH